MLKKAFLLIIFLLLAMLPPQFLLVKASPGVIYVRDDFQTIQEAVYKAGLGDTIIVRPGLYEENLIINQTVTLIGENKATTIIDGGETDNVVTLSNTTISMSGFTIRNGRNFSGIEAPHFGNHHIFNNILINNAFGINLCLTSGNTVVDNTLIDNSMVGIKVVSSSNNNISSNYVSKSAFGIKMEGADNNFIVGNTVSDTSYGIYLYSSNSNDVDRNNVSGKTIGIYSVYSNDINIRHNIVSDCSYGIELYGATSNDVLNNTVVQNAYGIYLVLSNTNIFDGNLASNNDWGIHFYDSDSNTVTYNTASYNAHGIYLAASSSGSSIYKNNFLENAMQAYENIGSTNVWYTTVEDKNYGNYWSDYLGEDTDGDGVGDYPPASLPHWFVDNYPLMNPTNAVHDVAVTSVVTSDSSACQGQTVNIIVIVRNEGTMKKSFIVTAKYYDRTIGTQSVINLPRCENTTLLFSWNTTSVPMGFKYEISAIAEPTPGETDKFDNTFIDGTVFVTILSDIRGPESPPGSGLYPPDGVVDGWDYGFIGLAFGKTSSNPDWEEYKIADIRGPEDPPGSGLYPADGVVDGWDYGYCGLVFGKSIYD